MNTIIPSDKLGDYLRTAKPQPGVPDADPRFPAGYIGPKTWPGSEEWRPGSAPAPVGEEEVPANEPGPPGLGAAADLYSVPSVSQWPSDNTVISGDLCEFLGIARQSAQSAAHEQQAAYERAIREGLLPNGQCPQEEEEEVPVSEPGLRSKAHQAIIGINVAYALAETIRLQLVGGVAPEKDRDITSGPDGDIRSLQEALCWICNRTDSLCMLLSILRAKILA